MNTGDGLISKIFSYIWSPSNDETTMTEWSAALVGILVLSFLWATVIHMMR